MAEIIIQEPDGDYEVHVPFKARQGKRYKLIEIEPIDQQPILSEKIMSETPFAFDERKIEQQPLQRDVIQEIKDYVNSLDRKRDDYMLIQACFAKAIEFVEQSQYELLQEENYLFLEKWLIKTEADNLYFTALRNLKYLSQRYSVPSYSDIEKWHNKMLFEHRDWYHEDSGRNAIEWFKSQIKAIDLREEILKYDRWQGKTYTEERVNEYLNQNK